MTILHIGIAAHFTEDMTYQDNVLTEMNQRDGHKVIYITDAYKYVDGVLVHVGQEDKVLNNGVRLIRIEYDKVLGQTMTKKILKAQSISAYLKSINPDVILYHGTGGFSLLYVAEYVKKRPSTKFYVDCHASTDNSSRNILSWMLNRFVHGFFLKKALPCIDKVFYVAEDAKIYLKRYYHLKEELMEWFPLGGILFTTNERERIRQSIKRELGLDEESIVFSHSGKFDSKKKTIELVKAFRKIKAENVSLLLIGTVNEDIKKAFYEEINLDQRIKYLGWKKGDELIHFLLATDMYCQPGTVSATLQNAICCGCAIMTYPWETYKVYDNGNIVWVTNMRQIEDAFNTFANKSKLTQMSLKSLEFAEQFLDYQKIAKRIYR